MRGKKKMMDRMEEKEHGKGKRGKKKRMKSRGK